MNEGCGKMRRLPKRQAGLDCRPQNETHGSVNAGAARRSARILLQLFAYGLTSTYSDAGLGFQKSGSAAIHSSAT